MTCNVDIECPYCNFKNRITKDFDAFTKAEVMVCDSDEGGCYCKFVLETFAKPSIQTFKIEGQERKVV